MPTMADGQVSAAVVVVMMAGPKLVVVECGEGAGRSVGGSDMIMGMTLALAMMKSPGGAKLESWTRG